MIDRSKLDSTSTVEVRIIDEHVLLATISRPEVMNALDKNTCESLTDILSFLETQDHQIRCAVITGKGESFSAGGDLKIRNDQHIEQWARDHEVAENMMKMFVDSPVPWIAAVNGPCYGGGLELALVCDFIYADRDARFAQSECRLGIMPGGMGTQNLPRAVGERRAKELIFSGRAFSASEALDWGLINRLCEPRTVVEESIACAERISTSAPLSVRQAKKSIHRGLQTDLNTGYRIELELYYKLLDTEDRTEGVRAFNEKRRPIFRGR